mmetsp:Transcript_143229/g.260038  ORF Transcript_143229/g.260038 Transcript_143229/m.260038 type:complete len:294 (-) Transcript_143229:74-955(-)
MEAVSVIQRRLQHIIKKEDGVSSTGSSTGGPGIDSSTGSSSGRQCLDGLSTEFAGIQALSDSDEWSAGLTNGLHSGAASTPRNADTVSETSECFSPKSMIMKRGAVDRTPRTADTVSEASECFSPKSMIMKRGDDDHSRRPSLEDVSVIQSQPMLLRSPRAEFQEPLPQSSPPCLAHIHSSGPFRNPWMHATWPPPGSRGCLPEAPQPKVTTAPPVCTSSQTLKRISERRCSEKPQRLLSAPTRQASVHRTPSAPARTPSRSPAPSATMRPQVFSMKRHFSGSVPEAMCSTRS